MHLVASEFCTFLRRSHSRDRNVIQLQRSSYKQLWCLVLQFINYHVYRSKYFSSWIPRNSRKRIYRNLRVYGMTPRSPLSMNDWTIRKNGRREERLAFEIVSDNFMYFWYSLSRILFLIFICIFYVYNSFSFKKISASHSRNAQAHITQFWVDEIMQNRTLFCFRFW